MRLSDAIIFEWAQRRLWLLVCRYGQERWDKKTVGATWDGKQIITCLISFLGDVLRSSWMGTLYPLYWLLNSFTLGTTAYELWTENMPRFSNICPIYLPCHLVSASEPLFPPFLLAALQMSSFIIPYQNLEKISIRSAKGSVITIRQNHLVTSTVVLHIWKAYWLKHISCLPSQCCDIESPG